MKKNVPVLRGINIQDCCPSCLKKRPSVWMKRSSLSVTGQSGHGTRDNRPGSGGSEGLLVSGLGRALFTERSPTSAYRVRQPHHPSFIRVILTAGSGIWQQQEKADKGAEIQGDIGERKEMGCLFLSPTLQVCVYLKKTKTKTSFNWVVLVFKINQGGGWWWGWCARRPGSLAGSPAAAFWGRGPDLSPGHSCSRG